MDSQKTEKLDGRTLDRLYEVIGERRKAPPAESHTARMFEKGLPKIAQKVGEEAVEALIEGVNGEKQALAEESADLLYHLLLLWAARDLPPQRVWEVLEGRAQKGVRPLSEASDEGK